MLKATVEKAEFDGLNDAVKAHYKEQGGKYVLETSGFVPENEHQALKTTAAEFRDNNVALLKALGVTTGPADGVRKAAEYAAAATELATIKPEHAALKDAAAKLKDKGVDKPDDLDVKIAAAVKAAVDPLTQQLATEATARQAAQRAADQASFREGIGQAATAAGVDPRYLRHVIREAEAAFEWKNGALAPKDGVKNPVDPLKALEPGDWLVGLKTTDPAFFKPSSGAGAGDGAAGGGRPNARQVAYDPLSFGKNAADIAAGKAVVTGVE